MSLNEAAFVVSVYVSSMSGQVVPADDLAALPAGALPKSVKVNEDDQKITCKCT